MIKHLEDLLVWQKADALALQIYEVTQRFPKEELYGLVSQMRRAAVSIPANIVEGFERQYKKEFIQFLEIAKASLSELGYYLKFSQKVKYLDAEVTHTLLAQTQEIGKMLNGLVKSLRMSKHK